jgi:hypothetical protein
MDLSNYVDVPTRFAMALERWPELRLVENRPEIITIGDKVFISLSQFKPGAHLTTKSLHKIRHGKFSRGPRRLLGVPR